MTNRINPLIPEGINTTEEHPLKEFISLLIGITIIAAIVVVVLSVTVRFASSYIPFAWETKVASYFENNIFGNSEKKKAANFIEVEKALNLLVTSLSKEMELPEHVSFSVHFVSSDIPNAFATLGGHIFVTEGLLDSINSENGLSMVLAHEMAHIKFRHPIRALGVSATFALLLTAIIGNQGNDVAQSVLGQSGLITMLSYSRNMERESDLEAIDVVNSYYGHVGGADEFFTNMLGENNQAKWETIFQTHPGIEDRIRMIKQEIVVGGEGWQQTPLDKRITQR